MFYLYLALGCVAVLAAVCVFVYWFANQKFD